MTITRTDKTPTSTMLLIRADSSDLEPIKRHVLAHFRHSVKVSGFRAGTAPMALVEKNVNQDQLQSEFLDHALNELYRKAINQENLRPVGEPNVKLSKFVPYTELEIEVESDIIGTVSLPDYKKIKLTKDPVTIAAKDINEVIKSLQEREAERNEVQRPTKPGDEVVIDFSGKDKEGIPVAGTDSKDYPLKLGSGNFIPGFEDNLIGVKTGDKKDFTVRFPKDYGAAALQNKDVAFSVEVKKVSELVLPKLDDTFAAKAGPFKTLAELKTDIKKQLKLERQQQADNEYANKVVGEIVAQSKADIPKSMIDEQIVRMEEEEKRNLTYKGQTWQEHLKEEGISEEQHRERQIPQAEQQIKGGLILSEIAEKEGITADPKEVDERITLLKGQYQDNAMRAELDKPNARQDIESRLLTEKTIARLVEVSSK